MRYAAGNASGPTDVTVGGYAGKKVELWTPDGLDIATCDEEELGRWYQTNAATEDGPYTFGNGQRDIVYILDLAGSRQIIETMYLPGTSQADLAELDQIVASIRFEPRK